MSLTAVAMEKVLPIDTASWGVLLSNNTQINKDELAVVAGNLLEQATVAIKAQDLEKALNPMLMGLAISKYTLQTASPQGTNNWRKMKASLENAETVARTVGINVEEIDASVETLKIYLTQNEKYLKDQELRRRGSISVTGIIPLISTRSEVAELRSGGSFNIGGYKITCSDEYNERHLLLQMKCLFGEPAATTDINSKNARFSSNAEVFSVLVKGYTAKLGKPRINRAPAQTPFGVTVISEMAVWSDKYGNELTLFSAITRADLGGLILKAKDQIEKDKLNKLKEQRAF